MEDVDPVIFFATAATLIGITILPAVVISAFSFTSVKWGRDPARHWVLFLRTALVFYALASIFAVAAWSVPISSGSFGSSRSSLEGPHLANLGVLMSWFMHSSISLLFVELARGIHLTLHVRTRKWARVGTAVARGLAAALALLAIVPFALQVNYLLIVRSGGEMDRGSLPATGLVRMRINASLIISFCVCSAATAILAIRTAIKCKGNSRAGRAPIFFLVSSLLWLVCNIWHIVIALVLGTMGPDMPELVSFGWVNALDAVLSYWTVFVALVLVYVVGTWKVGGVWTRGSHPLGSRQPSLLEDATSSEQHWYEQHQHQQHQQSFPRNGVVEAGCHGSSSPVEMSTASPVKELLGRERPSELSGSEVSPSTPVEMPTYAPSRRKPVSGSFLSAQ